MGNQLFKFFHGLKIAHNFGENFSIDISWFTHKYKTSNKVNNRTYELSYFELINLVPTFISQNKKVDLLRERTGRNLPPRIQKIIGHMTEQNEYLFTIPPKLIDGDFQKISDLPNFNVIKEFVKFPEIKSSWLRNEFSILETGMVVAIHVRRTDYMNFPEIYDVLTIEYYRNAVNYFKEKYGVVSFWLFSDDIEGAQVFLKDVVRFHRIVDSPRDVPVGENLRLMSSFKGIIVANSTFSWWAAYIGFMSGRTLEVILPSRFSTLSNDNPAKYLKLPDWYMLDV